MVSRATPGLNRPEVLFGREQDRALKALKHSADNGLVLRLQIGLNGLVQIKTE